MENVLAQNQKNKVIYLQASINNMRHEAIDKIFISVLSILRVKGFIIELFFETSFFLNIGQRTRYFWSNGLNLTTLLQVGGKLRQRHPGLQRAGHEAGAGEG